jgi:hypothetical protein
MDEFRDVSTLVEWPPAPPRPATFAPIDPLLDLVEEKPVAEEDLRTWKLYAAAAKDASDGLTGPERLRHIADTFLRLYLPSPLFREHDIERWSAGVDDLVIEDEPLASV